MKRLFVCLFAFGIGAGTVVNAQQVSAPSAVVARHHEMPDRASLAVYAPVVREEPYERLVRMMRERVVEEAADQDCGEWAGLAFDVGWPVNEIPKLLRVIYRESRCQPTACSIPDRPDQRRCRDWGLTQINDYSWKRTVRGQGLEMDDLWQPDHNLRFALWLFRYSEESTGCGWSPWSLGC